MPDLVTILTTAPEARPYFGAVVVRLHAELFERVGIGERIVHVRVVVDVAAAVQLIIDAVARGRRSKRSTGRRDTSRPAACRRCRARCPCSDRPCPAPAARGSRHCGRSSGSSTIFCWPTTLASVPDRVSTISPLASTVTVSRYRADLHDDSHRRSGVGADIHAALFETAEAGCFDRHSVGPNRHQGKEKAAVSRG